jgi:tripartite-type tricarboxylate transporter receptor subunit TctC
MSTSNRFGFQFLFLMTLIVALALVSWSTSKAETPAEFYKGKVIELVITAGTGSTADRYGRALLPYIPQALGANARPIEKRGGGGVEGYNYVYQAKPDGLHIGVGTLLSPVLNQLFGASGVLYKVEDYQFIAGLGSEFYVVFAKSGGPYESIASLRTAKGVKIAGASAKGNITLALMSLLEILGLEDGKVISGYKGVAEQVVAVITGECTAGGNMQSSVIGPVQGGTVKPILTFTEKRQPGFFSQVPALPELMQLNAEQQGLLDLWDKEMIWRQILILPPGVPAERVAFLQAAFDKLSKDSKYRADVSRAMGYEVLDWVSGSELRKQALSIMNRKAELISLLKRIFEKHKP